MFRLWLHIEELDPEGEPVGEAVGPVEVADFDELGDAEALFDRLLDLSGADSTVPADQVPQRDAGAEAIREP